MAQFGRPQTPRQAAINIARTIKEATAPVRKAAKVTNIANRDTKGEVTCADVNGLAISVQIRENTLVAVNDWIWIKPNPATQGTWVFDGFVVTSTGGVLASTYTPLVISPAGTNLNVGAGAGGTTIIGGGGGGGGGVTFPDGHPVHDHSATAQGGQNLRDIQELDFAAATELTIATGVVTRTQVYHRVDTQADAASDDLDTISGGADGDFLVLRAENSARTVIVKHNTGNIWNPAAADILLDDAQDHCMLIYDGANLKWCVIGFSVAGYPFSTITVDLTDSDADYGNLDTAFAIEPNGTIFMVGPGDHQLSANGLPANGALTGLIPNTASRILGYVVSGVKYGLPMDGGGTAYNVYLAGISTSATPAASVLVVSNGEFRNCWLAASSIGGDAYGVDVAAAATCTLTNCTLQSSAGGTAYGVRAGAGATVYLNGVHIMLTANFFTGAGAFVGIFQDDSGNLWRINGASGTEILIRPAGVDPTGHTHSKLVGATDGTPDPSLSASTAGVITAINWIQSDAHCFKVKNTSGGAVGYTNVGYIDENGEFKTTTTAYLNAAWCVVVTGGANNADIYVARRGRVDVILNGNCSAGDYLYTSTTVLQAQPQTYVRPEVFAVALTANAGGAGGTCSALLLTGTQFVPASSSEPIYRVDSHAGSDFVATIATLPGGATLTYNAPSSGNENNLDPFSTANLGKLVIHNTTRGTNALLDDATLGTNTIVLTANVPAGWVVGDTITMRSQTNTQVLGSDYFYEVDLSSADNTVVPETARAFACDLLGYDSGAAGGGCFAHPFAAYVDAKQIAAREQVAGILNYRHAQIPLIQQRFTLMDFNASGAATRITNLRLTGYFVAVP